MTPFRQNNHFPAKPEDIASIMGILVILCTVLYAYKTEAQDRAALPVDVFPNIPTPAFAPRIQVIQENTLMGEGVLSIIFGSGPNSLGSISVVKIEEPTPGLAQPGYSVGEVTIHSYPVNVTCTMPNIDIEAIQSAVAEYLSLSNEERAQHYLHNAMERIRLVAEQRGFYYPYNIVTTEQVTIILAELGIVPQWTSQPPIPQSNAILQENATPQFSIVTPKTQYYTSNDPSDPFDMDPPPPVSIDSRTGVSRYTPTNLYEFASETIHAYPNTGVNEQTLREALDAITNGSPQLFSHTETLVGFFMGTESLSTRAILFTEFLRALFDNYGSPEYLYVISSVDKIIFETTPPLLDNFNDLPNKLSGGYLISPSGGISIVNGTEGLLIRLAAATGTLGHLSYLGAQVVFDWDDPISRGYLAGEFNQQLVGTGAPFYNNELPSGVTDHWHVSLFEMIGNFGVVIHSTTPTGQVQTHIVTPTKNSMYVGTQVSTAVRYLQERGHTKLRIAIFDANRRQTVLLFHGQHIDSISPYAVMGHTDPAMGNGDPGYYMTGALNQSENTPGVRRIAPYCGESRDLPAD